MTYQQVLDFLYSQLPMYQRIGSAAYKHDLGKTLELDKHFGHPHKRFKSIHIAGTNGKGSVAHSLASIFQQAGYKTGLYTSPHYLDFRERIKINGQKIPADYVVNFVEQNLAYFKQIRPSFFEITVAMAFQYFADMNVDIAIVEVGMGGRLDSTNIIRPLVSVITNIGLDHTQFLGNTLTQIAAEKAGIIKPNVPVVLGAMQPMVSSVFLSKAQQLDSPVYLANHLYSVRNLKINSQGKLSVDVYRSGKLIYPNLIFGLTGFYQRDNIPVILQTIDVVNQRTLFNISEQDLRLGLENVVENTGIMGRWQILSKNPWIIADAGHNEDGIKAVVSQIKQLNYKTLHFIFGMVNDKEPGRILRLLPQKAEYYFTQASVPRAMNSSLLAQEAANFGLKGKSFQTVDQAIEAALSRAASNDLIFIGGSTFVVADAIKALENRF